MPRSKLFIATLLALATLLISATLSVLRPPVPRIHDEFSYLLAGDTFAHGRAANPTHPLWRHFETMHVIQTPSYASKYPPGQGLMLAVGQVAAHWPIVGVWLTSAAAVVAIYWMLLGFVPPRWAAVGAATLLVMPGFQLTWGQSFWGGTLAFAGGAMVLGAAARFVSIQYPLRIHDALIMAIGALLLAVTRPFEGAVTCLLVAGWVVLRWSKQGWPAMTDLAVRVVAPQLAVLGLGLGALAVYNQAVTGDPLTMPYKVHEQQYGMCPLFLFGAPKPAHDYQHLSLDQFHSGWSMEWFDKQRTAWGILQTKARFLRDIRRVLIPLPLLLPALLLPWWRGGKLRGPLLLLLIAWLITQITIWNWPHYIAPIAPVLVLLAVYGLRNLRLWARNYTWGHSSATLLVAAQAAAFVWAATAWVNHNDGGFHLNKTVIANYLQQQPGKDLVLVEYSPLHHPHNEWVYNGADIDSADIVWAHSMSPQQNTELIEYYGDRTVWRLAADAEHPRLMPYASTARQTAEVVPTGEQHAAVAHSN